MRINKKGEIKLDRNDIRVGNFVLRCEKGYYKLADISGVFTIRLSSFATFAGRQIEDCLAKIKGGEKDLEKFIHIYAAVIYNVICALPDIEFLNDINEAAIRCVNRHKDLYGVKDDITLEEDNEIVKEEQALAEAMEEVRKEEGIKE